ncbi:MAG: thioredoxin family protein [Deltaproteobacteria bacterium]|nr:thioredoxin family protein [Deltaproteobacteria bacterium]
MAHQPMGARLAIGTTAPDFTLPATDGKEYSFARHKGAKGTVVVFACNHCPYVKAYDQRINDAAREFMPKGIMFFVINANDEKNYPDDSFAKMKEKAIQYKLPYPYLRDATQKVATDYGAGCTPEVFCFDAAGKLCYTGRVDDNMEDLGAVKQRYLWDACTALVVGTKPKLQEVHPIGCSIKWSR